MTTFKSFNQIVASMLDRMVFTQPNLDTKPGTISRDLFIDLPADQIEKLYRVISYVYEKQSPETASGSDLDRYGSNFGISRTQGSFASGTVVFTTNSLIEDIQIPGGSTVTAKNGASYAVVGNYVMQSSAKSKHASVANRLKRSLQIAGINDPYAIEVPVQATRAGTAGNVGSLQILNHNIQSDLRVVNLSSMSGGANQESDNVFRTRIASVFSGANTGTALGYRNAALSVNGVVDALIVEPGNSLMLRDGTEIIKTNDGTSRILNSGTGGKVDIYILGKLLREVSESFIFRDQSGSGDVTDDRNDFTIGSTVIDLTRTSQERRYLALKSGLLPTQPVSNIVSIFGSESGFLQEKTIDANGVVSGNFELIRDENPETGGSPFSFDRIHFINKNKNISGELVVKSSLNSYDSVSSKDIVELGSIYSDISIIQENSAVLLSDRSIITTMHKPVSNVSRVQNRTTGEIYVIESQELSSAGINDSGNIKISGRNLPNQSDILSVDYVWRKYYDKYSDFNGFKSNSIFFDEKAESFIDWGPTNGIRNEASIIDLDDDGVTFKITLANNISRISSVRLETVEESTVVSTSGLESIYPGKIVLENIISNVHSVVNSSGLELYNSKENNGTFSGSTIFLPTDSVALIGETVIVRYNSNELYMINDTDASFSNNIITLPSQQILEDSGIYNLVLDASNLSTDVFVNYMEDRSLILPTLGLQQLPFVGNEISNQVLFSNGLGVANSSQPITFNFNANLPVSNLKISPSYLGINITNTVSPGKLRVTGTTWNRVTIAAKYGTIFNGLNLNLRNEINKKFGLTSFDNNYFISRIDEIYTKDSSGKKDKSFDRNGYYIANNKFDLFSSRSDSSLFGFQARLPGTTNNNSLFFSPSEIVYIECVISKQNDFEDIYFSSNKLIYSSKQYAFIGRITASSGFRNTSGIISGNISISFSCQPQVNSNYYVDYSFFAPKEGERLTVRYNINQLLLDATNTIEQFRPITADVLVKEAKELLVDVSATIMINEDRLDSADSILQDASNAVSSLLSTNRLGSVIDYSDVISVIAGINGIDSVNISLFNITNEVGRKSYIRALDNQTISPGNINIEAVTRKNFRIT